MPKTSVSPLATRNSTSPYCTPLSSCTAKVARSMQAPVFHISRQGREMRKNKLRRKPAAEPRIRERLVRDRDVAIEPALRLAQVDVLHDIMRLREADRPARRVDLGGLHGGEHLVACRDVALHGGEPD